MERVQRFLYWAIIASEASHVFCCVLPTLFSVFSLMAGLGLVAAMPAGMVSLHDALHAWEIPLISLSGAVVLLGWGVYAYSRKIDCHDTGCVHGSCEPQKKSAHIILKIATVLFVVNVFVYTVFHRGMDITPVHAGSEAAQIEDHHAHSHHGHAH